MEFMPKEIYSVVTFYLVFLVFVLVLGTVQILAVFYKLLFGSLLTANDSLKALLLVKFVSALLYVWLSSIRELAYVATFNWKDPIMVEHHVGCGLYYWISSALQWTVSFMLMFATVKRILSIHHPKFHAAHISLRTAIGAIMLAELVAYLLNLHYFLVRSKNIPSPYNGDVRQICVPDKGTGYDNFWHNVLPIMDAVFHMVVPCVVMLPVHVAIEKHFAHEEFLLQTLPPREKNKLRYKRQRDQHYITETGWTWTIFYAGWAYIIANLPLNIYLWYIKVDKFYALYLFTDNETDSALFALQLFKYLAHVLWFPIYHLTGSDGKKVIPKKTYSQHLMPPMGPSSHYSLRARTSRSNEEAAKTAAVSASNIRSGGTAV